MLYVLYYTLGVLAWNARSAFSTPVTYDQRQTGDVNVQIHLKDIQVVALVDSELLEDYTDYDYAYDYSDFTIKPIVKPTTSSSSSSTTSVKPWFTWPTNSPNSSTTTTSIAVETEISEPQSSTSKNNKSEATTESSVKVEATNETDSDSSKVNSTIYNLGNLQGSNETKMDVDVRIRDDADGQSSNTENITQIEEEQTNQENQENLKKICPTGYALSKKGRCRSTQIRRRISLVPLSMKLGSKLSEKGRFTVRKDLPIRVYKSEPRQ